MKITIEEVPAALKNDVVRVGGECKYYEELDECFIAIFHHHEIETHGDYVTVIDELTGYELELDSTDFFTIEMI